MARSIVADIALYYEGELQAYLEQRDPGPLAPVLEEGRRLLAAVADARGYDGRDPILEAFDALVAALEQN